MAIGKGITLRSHHVGKIDIDEEQARELALKSIRIDNMLKDGVEEAEISVSLKVLEIAIGFCSQLVHLHTNTGTGGGGGENTQKKEIRKKIAGFDRPVLMELMIAVNQLLIEELLDMACYEALGRIKGRRTKYNLLKTFNISESLFYEEEDLDEMRRENELVGMWVSAELMSPGEVDPLKDEDSLSMKISNLHSCLFEAYQEHRCLLIDIQLKVSLLDEYTELCFIKFFLDHKPQETIQHFMRRLELSLERHEYYQKVRNKLPEISARTDEKADLMSIKLMKDNAKDEKEKVDQIILDMQISGFFKDCPEYEETEAYLSLLKERHYVTIDEILLYLDLNLQPSQRVILRMMERSQIEMLETDTESQNQQDENISIKEEPELPSLEHSEDSRLNSNRSTLEELKDSYNRAHYICRQHNFLRVLNQWINETIQKKTTEAEESTSSKGQEFKDEIFSDILPKFYDHLEEYRAAHEKFIVHGTYEHSSLAMSLINITEQGRHKVDADYYKLISQYRGFDISNAVLDLFDLRQKSYRAFRSHLRLDDVRGVLDEEDKTFRSRKMKGVPLRGEQALEEKSLDSQDEDVYMGEELELKRTKGVPLRGEQALEEKSLDSQDEDVYMGEELELKRTKGVSLRGEQTLEEKSLDSQDGDVYMGEELELKRTKVACNHDSKKIKWT